MNQGYRRTVVLVTSLVYIFSSLPYLYGYLRQTGAQRFTGIVFDVPDTAQYYAWMRAFAKQPLIANPLTPEPGAERFFNLQWWLLGQLAYNTPLGPNWTYQILRVVALVAFAVALAIFCNRAIRPWRSLGFTLTMLSSGFGWILVILKQALGEADLRSPLSVQIAEANTYFSAMAFPHLLVAGALSLTIFYAFLRACDTSGRARHRWLACTAVLTLSLGFSHGYDLIPVMAIPGLFAVLALWRERSSWWCWPPRNLPPSAWNAATIVAAAVPPALYVLSLTRLDATWRGVLSQYDNAGVFTPAPPQLIILLGLPLLVALPQLRPSAWRANNSWQTFIRLWMVGGFVLIYIPTNYQVKMLTAYQVPICLLAAQTLGEAFENRATLLARLFPERVGKVSVWMLPALLLAFTFLTNGYLTAWRFVDLKRAQYPYYLSNGDIEALEIIGRIASSGQVVLSSPEVGIFVPVYSDARPFVAHWAQTLHFFARRDAAAHLFAPTTPEEVRRTLLADNEVQFVLVGPAEALLGGTSAPIVLPLERFGGEGTAIYLAGEARDASARTLP